MSELRIVKFSEMTLIKLGLRNDKLYFKDEADKMIAHQKYKRCLAMAKLAIKDDYLPWNMKWHKRWLELAEKFKEGV